jgi:hypothetical protein
VPNPDFSGLTGRGTSLGVAHQAVGTSGPKAQGCELRRSTDQGIKALVPERRGTEGPAPRRAVKSRYKTEITVASLYHDFL